MLVPFWPPAYGGAGTQAATLVRALGARGVRIAVLAVRPQSPDVRARETSPTLEVRRYAVPRIDEVRKLVFGLKSACWLARDRDWRALHVHGFGYWSALPILVARARGRPVLVKTTLLGVDDAGPAHPTLPRRLLIGLYRGCDVIIALSEALVRGFEADGGFRGRVLKIPNGVDTDLFRPADIDERAALRRRYELPADAWIVASAGRLESRKNTVDLVRGVGRMRQRPVCVALVGPDSPVEADRRALTTECGELGAGAKARLLGRRSQPELAEILRACDAFALASSAEGLPNSLLEAMASGLACVASDVPGSSDVLSGGGGRTYPLRDVDALAGVLDEFASDPEAARALGREARELAVRDYSVARVADRYVDLYTELLDEPSPWAG